METDGLLLWSMWCKTSLLDTTLHKYAERAVLWLYFLHCTVHMHMIAHSDKNSVCKCVCNLISCHVWSSDRCVSFIMQMPVNCEQLQVHLQLLVYSLFVLYMYLWYHVLSAVSRIVRHRCSEVMAAAFAALLTGASVILWWPSVFTWLIYDRVVVSD